MPCFFFASNKWIAKSFICVSSNIKLHTYVYVYIVHSKSMFINRISWEYVDRSPAIVSHIYIEDYTLTRDFA